MLQIRKAAQHKGSIWKAKTKTARCRAGLCMAVPLVQRSVAAAPALRYLP
jgi:hypothetical protein